LKQATKDALAWLAEDTTRTPYKAAQKFEVAQSTLTRAMRQQASRSKCPCCGGWKYDQICADLPKKHSGKVDTAAVLGVQKIEGEELV